MPVDSRKDLHTEYLELMMGPSHPATHGTIQMELTLDGETIVRSDVEPGYLHRGFEKECEDHRWNQAIPYTDRLNYVSPIINNVGFVMAVEKLCGLEVPPRGQYLRMILSEMSRITDHLTCLAAQVMELGAFSAFLYFIKAREYYYELLESVCGARVTTSWTRVGGARWDIPDDFVSQTRKALPESRRILEDIHGLFDKNRIFLDRMVNVGVISKEDALSYGITGPFLRSTGIGYDVRKANPYLVYDQVHFDIPTGTNGDNYDRYMVRMQEMEQSMRIIEQGLDKLPDGPISVDDPRFTLPPKEEVYDTIEGVINHFKLVYDGIHPPKGEAYGYVEGANGELGFYVVSDGGSKPVKCRCRPPCFPMMAALGEILEGYMVADIIPTFGSINMIGGEMDR
ncbi:MAG: NADH-quinone oxidoreductase subunit D [bacterium]